MQSIFSKIVNKEIPCHFIAEDSNSIAFMDINPIALGHVLVVPKIEVDYLFDLESNLYHSLWDFTKFIAEGLRKTIPCKRIGVNVIGLEVSHAHIHLIPINNMGDINFSNKIDIPAFKLEKIAKEIANNLNN